MLTILSILCASAALGAAAPDYDAMSASARETLRQLIELDTSNPPGNEERAVALLARKLDDAGIAYEITEFEPHRKNLVARLKGTGEEKPVMLLGHVDVVGASGQAWTVEPHKLTEKDGYLYGRGTSDMLGEVAINLEVFLRLKREAVPLTRDVLFVAVGDEESGGAGVRFLIKNHPEQIAAGIVLNETGGPILDASGKVTFVGIQAAEKIYQDFELVTKGQTGHSSVPLEDNAIYRLSGALERLGRFKFPARLLPVTRASYEARAKGEGPKRAAAMRELARSRGALPAGALKTLEADPSLSAELRTTCVATLMSGGTRINALPAEAHASLNCRILPDESAETVASALRKVIGDAKVELREISDFGHAGPSPLESPDLDKVRATIRELWPAATIGPILSRGATDSRYLRGAGIASYGLNPLPMSDEDRRRAHGIDERIPTSSLRQGLEFYDRLVAKLAGAKNAR